MKASTNNVRLNDLLAYLDRLSELYGSDYHCTTEISECINAIRAEMSIGGKCHKCNGSGMVSIGEGIRGVKKCVACRGDADE